jgi:hypothetical protein
LILARVPPRLPRPDVRWSLPAGAANGDMAHCATNRSDQRGARRISRWATLYVAEGERIRHDASADMMLMRIPLWLRASNQKARLTRITRIKKRITRKES